MTLGAKAWVSTWSTWGLDQKPYNGSAYQIVVPLESNTEIALTPVLTAGYGKWRVAFSYMTKTKYDLTGAEPAGPLQHPIGVRSEIDSTLYYYVLPRLAATVGYKQLRQQFGTTLKWSGPTLGLVGTAPLGAPGLDAYGTLAYGFFRLDLPSGQTDAYGHTSRSAGYELGEVGLSYNVGAITSSWASHFSVTLGYRTQTVTTKSYGLSANPLSDPAAAAGYTQVDVRDHTQGLTLSLVGTF